MMVPLLMFVCECCFVQFALIPLLTLLFWRTGPYRPRLIGTAVLAGYFTGGILVWSLIPRAWPLTFLRTLAAAVDAGTYGHPVEHYAEGIVILMLICCPAGAAIGGTLASLIARYNRHACAT